MIPAALAPLVSHLWQSTLFAAAAGMLTLALRRNRASVRYGLWLAASYKFLIPFSLLVALGRHFHWRTAATVMVPVVVRLTDTVSAPLLLTPAPTVMGTPRHGPLLPIVFGTVWACGFLVVVTGWLREWRRIRVTVRTSKPIASSLPIPILSTSKRIEPGVFGLFRPVLLFPDGIADHLTSTELNAIFAHELCHVRRRDNLTAAVHMLVEAIFWFYPLVWWLGARLIEERERACDEQALANSGGARTYAESVLKVCKLYLESGFPCVSGVTGSDLKKRIERIMKNSFAEALSRKKKWILAATAAAALMLPILSGGLTIPWLVLAQSSAPAWQAAAGGKMAFDVASVKPTQERARPTSNVPLLGDAYAPTGGLFSATSTSLANYLRFAFKDMKTAYQETTDMAAAPGWLRSQLYDIEARARNNPTKDQMRLMVQSLLADRFKLAVHYEKRQLPVFAMVLSKEGKTGAQIKPDDGTCPTTATDVQAMNAAPQLPSPSPSATVASQVQQIPCGALLPVPASVPGRIRIAGRKVTLAFLIQMATTAPITGIDRPILDQTGLTGTYDLSIEFSPIVSVLSGPPPDGFTPDQSGSTFAETLQDQLGLKLVPQTGAVDVVVIDHVEQPSPN